MTKTILLSVRPRFAQGLLAGTKTAEVRRRFPNVTEGTVIVIYSSSPDRAVLGTVQARRLTRKSADEIWREHSTKIGITRPELDDYLVGAAEGSVIEVEAPQPWSRPVPLTELRRLLQVEPAQSFRYLTPKELSQLFTAAEQHGVVS